jgi:hypothetical protein
MSQFIDDFCNDLANINDNFLNTKQQNKMKVELIEEVKYNNTVYWLKIGNEYAGYFLTYEEAKIEFDKAITFTPKETVLESKEI